LIIEDRNGQDAFDLKCERQSDWLNDTSYQTCLKTIQIWQL